MTRMKRAVLAAMAGAAVLHGAASAHADEAAGIGMAGGVTLLTDYRLRGASLSDKEPVIQGFVEGALPVGDSFKLFAGIWASSLDKDAGAGAMETDFYGGVAGNIGKANWKLTYLRLVFHDAEDIDFDQFAGSVSAPLGPFDAGVGFVHDEYNGGGHSTYFYSQLGYTIPDTGLSVKGLVGYEDGSAWENKINWSLGAFYTYKGVTFGANYIDTNRFSPNSEGKNRAGSTVVFSIGAGF